MKFVEGMPSKVAFWVGAVGGALAVLAVGFLVTLPMVLKGVSFGDESEVAAVGATPTPADPLVTAGRQIGLNEGKFKSCLDSGRHKTKVQQQMQGGQSVGVSGTPASIVLTPNGKSKLISGAVPSATMKQVIDAMISGQTVDAALAEDTTGPVPPVDDRDHVTGNPAKAKVTVIVYTDFECPFCRRHHPTMSNVVEEYGDKVAWVYRHFPLSFHPNAQRFAEATECAAELGGNSAFWKLADQILAGKADPS